MSKCKMNNAEEKYIDMLFPKKNSNNVCPMCKEFRALYSNVCNCGYVFKASGMCSCGSGKQRFLFSHNCEDCAK